ncbi:MAG: TonB-dependent receptor [Methylococcales bacterium]
MKRKTTNTLFSCLLSLLLSSAVFAEDNPNTEQYKQASDKQVAKYSGETMVITTSHKLFPNTTVATPSFQVTSEDINKTNLVTASDAIKMAPSVHVRRRFYGDTNGITAIRGSTNMQTNHFNLFVDGIPLHNPVQTKWNGAPKWSLIAPNAIDTATVFYGPYSAEHKGSFGGTFDLKTKLPEKFEMHIEAQGFIQDSDRFGKNEALTGHREFISAGNRFDKFTVYGFFNHIENEGQPQSFGSTSNEELEEIKNDPETSGKPTSTVSGAAFPEDIQGGTSVISGDKGVNQNKTDLYAVKLGYDFTDDLRGLFTMAYENTTRSSESRSYLKDENGDTVWDGLATENGFVFEANPSNFGRGTFTGTENERQTLMYGLNLSGKISDNWSLDTTASYFDAFKDQGRESKFSKKDPAYQADTSGRINEIEAWWADYSIKLATDKLFGRDDLGFMAGYQYNHSFLKLESFESDDVISGSKDESRFDNFNGGATQTNSLFLQTDWDITDQLNIMAGGRYDYWKSRGHIENESLPGRDAVSRFSPKASLSFSPTDKLNFRYSFAKAYRFPVVEELFESSTNTNSVNISDPNLGPEKGYFHDLKIQYELPSGYASASVFYNTIDDEILRTRTRQTGGGTKNRTRSIDETETIGIELVYVQDYIFDLPLSLSLNGTWINKEIKKDSNNPDLQDNEWPRLPKWRANATATYHTTDNWDNVLSVQYRNDQHSTEKNDDVNQGVFETSSAYVLLNFKTTYRLDLGNDITTRFSVGVDNILNESYYDFHPYPQRTFFANIALDI